MSLKNIWNAVTGPFTRSFDRITRPFNKLVFDITCADLNDYKYCRDNQNEYDFDLPDKFYDDFRAETKLALELSRKLNLPIRRQDFKPLSEQQVVQIVNAIELS